MFVLPESLYKGPCVAGVVHGVDTLVGEVAHPASAVNVVLDKKVVYIQYSTVQYSTYSTVPYSTVQYSAVHTVEYSTVDFNTSVPCTTAKLEPL